MNTTNATGATEPTTTVEITPEPEHEGAFDQQAETTTQEEATSNTTEEPTLEEVTKQRDEALAKLAQLEWQSTFTDVATRYQLDGQALTLARDILDGAPAATIEPTITRLLEFHKAMSQPGPASDYPIEYMRPGTPAVGKPTNPTWSKGIHYPNTTML